MSNNSMLVLELVVNEHEQYFKKKFPLFNDLIDPLRFHESFCLSVNFGRQYGHTTYIKECLKIKPDCMLIHKHTGHIRNWISGDPGLNKAFKERRITAISSNMKGIRLDHIKTVFVDRGMFWESNKNIIDKVLKFFFENHSFSNPNPEFRIVILG